MDLLQSFDDTVADQVFSIYELALTIFTLVEYAVYFEDFHASNKDLRSLSSCSRYLSGITNFGNELWRLKLIEKGFKFLPNSPEYNYRKIYFDLNTELDGCLVNVVNGHNDILLRVAAKYGHEIIVNYALSGVENHQIRCGWDLYQASIRGYINIVNILIKRGGDIDSYKNDALIGASEHGHLDIVKLLLQYGAY